VFPLIYAFGMSLFSSTLATGTKFVGIDNYLKAFTDPLFLGGLGRVALYAIVMIPAQLLVALVAALVLDNLATWLSKLSRLLIFAPYAIPVVIGALMWSFLYSPPLRAGRDDLRIVRPGCAELPRERHDLREPRERRHLAVVRLLHDRHLRRPALDRPGHLRGGAHRRRERLAIARASRCR